MGGREKFSFEKVQETFEKRGCRLLESEYINDRTQMRYIAKCGHERTSTFNNFNRGKGDLCPKCRWSDNAKKESLGYDRIREAFESEGCKVLNDDFYRSTDPVRYVALCGHENETDYAHFIGQRMGRVCNRCSKSILYQYDYVRECFEQQGCTLLETEYKNCKTEMRYVAQCGHESKISFDAFLGTKKRKRCRQCLKVKYHEFPSDRNKTASKVWRKDVYARDNFTCVAWGRHGGDLNAHHLESYGDAPEKRFDVSNGVTLCPACHIRFHMAYGFGGNTARQFQEWMEGNTEVTTGTKAPVAP